MSNVFSQSRSGFSLIEILVVVSIIGILLAIILPRYEKSLFYGKQKVHQTEREMINAQIALYYLNNDVYPSGMSADSDWEDYDSSNTAISGSHTRYFPEGVPSVCNQGTAWSIHSDGYIDNSLHTNHE